MPDRTAEVTSFLVEVLAPHAPLTVIVDGGDHGAAAAFAARLAAAFPPSARAWAVDAVVGLTGFPGGARDSALDVLEPAADHVIVHLRTGPRGRLGEGERRAQVVIDHQDPRWPVIRHVHPRLAAPEQWYLAESRAFFEIRAEAWDDKFGEDLPAYGRAVEAAGLSPGETVIDVGCGTGRALPVLAAAAAPGGRVIGLDLTPRMLAEARRKGRDAAATLLMGDAHHLPIAGSVADVVFAAGLLQHLPDAAAGLAELARIARAGARLVLFHPSGRAALAARHGRTLGAGEPLNRPILADLLAGAGWQMTHYEDPDDHFLALAVRR
nr:methyltransferase domain-containing protein [uncultured Actinoplanes sp.]